MDCDVDVLKIDKDQHVCALSVCAVSRSEPIECDDL